MRSPTHSTQSKQTCSLGERRLELFDRVVEFLVEHGAGLEVVNASGQTPLGVVKRRHTWSNVEAAQGTETVLRNLGAHETDAQ